ncbi:MAG: hypothetical protein JWM97_1160 [Phycisphaerales bacterium]|nr:hypothetical protein [Phycisphaerales bacterium]
MDSPFHTGGMCRTVIGPDFFGDLMKAFSSLFLAALLCSCLYTTGCQTSHTESDKPGVFGGHTHEETTTTKNPITGDTNTSHTEQKTP